MPTTALVIGLGGTGTLVATHVKKELMENASTWPIKEVKILAFDTDHNAVRQNTVGASGAVRQAGRGTGGVQLRDGGEFYYVGGNVKRLMEEVAAGKHKHIGSWLQAKFYLDGLSLSDQMYNLNVGAGQFRQFGRLAIFDDLNDPRKRKIYNTLSDALVKLKQGNPTLTHLQIFIVGSIAGGTGAGMMADVAHLARAIATQPSVQLDGKLSVRGYLVLPDAFSRTISDPTILSEMHARAYAAMRENRRFTISFDYQRGYPMHYREDGNDPVWNGAIKGKLFDLLYYVDGQGGQAGNTSLKNGAAPAIADAISAAIDGEAGAAFSSYVVNVEAVRAGRMARKLLPQRAATFGAVGTYTIIFPIYHIVESWGHNLARELLNTILAPAAFDKTSEIPTQLATNQNQEEPGAEGHDHGFDFLRSQQAVYYEYVDQNGRTQTDPIEPTLLLPQLHHIANEARRQSSTLLPELMEQRIEDWMAHFLPEGEDEETRQLLNKVRTTINTRLYDNEGKGEVMTSNQLKQKQKEEAAAAADRITRGARAFKNRYLGSESSRSGRRSGGLYRKTLEQIAEYHLDRFSKRLDLTTLAILNGNTNTPQRQAKGGKVGFLAKFLAGLLEALGLAQQKLQEAQDQRREAGEGYLAAVARVESTRQLMIKGAEKKGILHSLMGEVNQAQQEYLQAEVALINLLKVEATEEAVLNLLREMQDYVRSAQESLQTWVEVAARSNQGLYAQVLKGQTQVENDRKADTDVRVRLIVSDKAYEDGRYQHYLSRTEGGWVNRLLAAVQWGVQHQTIAGRPRPVLALQAGGQPLGLDTFDENLSRWLELCRQPFASAHQEESVIGYLRQHRDYRDPHQLAEFIHDNSGVMLNLSGGHLLTGNFLRAYFQKDAAVGHTNYLRGVVDRLAEKSGQSVSAEDLATVNEDGRGAAENKFVQFVNSEDRFKFTFVFTQELIQLENIVSYSQSGAKEYLGSVAQGDRRWLHIFPAEVHASKYESLLRKLDQRVRLLDNEVTLQLEDMGRVRLFLLCYVYGLIQRASIQDKETGGQLNLWRLRLPPDRPFDDMGNPTTDDEIWLTQPQSDPHILDALTTFNYEERDVRFAQNLVKVINYRQVVDMLRRTRDEDTARRLQEGTAGSQSQDLLQQAEAVDGDTRQTIVRDLAQIDRIREYQNRFEKDTLPALDTRTQRDAAFQKDYDLISVFKLMLDEEVQSTRQTIKTRLQALRNLGTKIPQQSQGHDDDIIY